MSKGRERERERERQEDFDSLTQFLSHSDHIFVISIIFYAQHLGMFWRYGKRETGMNLNEGQVEKTSFYFFNDDSDEDEDSSLRFHS